MTTTDLEACNRLIADFMQVNLHGELAQWELTPGNFYKNLKYHSSWDWLLPVCKKIQHTEHPKGEFKKMEELRDLIDNSVTQNYEISEAWPFVVHFIQWYNSQPPKTTYHN